MSYGKSVVYDNIVFGSVYEVARYLALKKLEGSGEISQLQCHPKFLLCPEIEGFSICKEIYSRKTSFPELWAEFDFQYIRDNKIIIEDVKADGNFIKPNGKWNSSKRGWLLEAEFLVKVKMFLWMKDPSEWDFSIPVITKEELREAKSRISRRMDGKIETNRPTLPRAKKRSFKRH